MNKKGFENFKKSNKVKYVDLKNPGQTIFNPGAKNIPVISIKHINKAIHIEGSIKGMYESSVTLVPLSIAALVSNEMINKNILEKGFVDERLLQDQIYSTVEMLIINSQILGIDAMLNNLQQDLNTMIQQSMTGFGLVEAAAVATIVAAVVAVITLGFVVYDHYHSDPEIGGTGPNDDYDGDGNPNKTDEDDDNDGISDQKDPKPLGNGVIFQRELPDYFINHLLRDYRLDIGASENMFELVVHNMSYKQCFRVLVP